MSRSTFKDVIPYIMYEQKSGIFPKIKSKTPDFERVENPGL